MGELTSTEMSMKDIHREEEGRFMWTKVDKREGLRQCVCPYSYQDCELIDFVTTGC